MILVVEELFVWGKRREEKGFLERLVAKKLDDQDREEKRDRTNSQILIRQDLEVHLLIFS